VQSPDGRGAVTIEGHHAPVLGFAFSPIGLESGIGLSGRWVAYTEGAVGGVWFTRQVPVLHSSGFNFTFQVGGGLQWQRSPRTRVRLGYKFHHLSNARTGDENPGIDANVLLVGVERTLGRATRH
jgi:opacity protein-like surface antigen